MSPPVQITAVNIYDDTFNIHNATKLAKLLLGYQ